jgi:hypothetical protein
VDFRQQQRKTSTWFSSIIITANVHIEVVSMIMPEKITKSNALDPWNNAHDFQLKYNFGLTTLTCFRVLVEVLNLK